MNRQETTRALSLLDACIDHAKEPEIMIALNAARGQLLHSWQRDCCADTDAELLNAELAALPALCREGYHPALPMRLTRAIFLLCAPAVNQARDCLPLCREQAARIRSLRSWRESLAELLAHYDEENAAEAQQLLDMQLTMMEELFVQLLMMARGKAAVRAAQHRAKRLEEIAEIRACLSLQDVSAAQADAWTACEMTREKFSEFAAEIAASASLLQVKEPQRRAAAYRTERATEESEE